MKIRLALLAVPFLALACNDAEQATLLEPPAIAADVTTEGLVTQCIQVTLTCAKNVTSGWVYYRVTPNGADESLNCVAKCTVNGRDVGGKGLAKLVAKYVKGEC
jgi:hypothetical protein